MHSFGGISIPPIPRPEYIPLIGLGTARVGNDPVLSVGRGQERSREIDDDTLRKGRAEEREESCEQVKGGT